MAGFKIKTTKNHKTNKQTKSEINGNHKTHLGQFSLAQGE